MEPIDSTPESLRLRAEQVAVSAPKALPIDLGAMSLQDLRHAVHELQVHQIELDMQNDELRRTQAELDVQRARYFDLYDLAPVGYCSVNDSGVIVQANLELASLLGRPRAGLVGQAISRFIGVSSQDVFYQHRQQLLQGDLWQACELQLLVADGTRLWVNAASSATFEASGAPVLHLALTNVNERRRLDQLLLDRNIELQKAKMVAEAANMAKSDFLSSMSHELRTPLTAILGFAQLIDSGTPPPNVSQKRSVDQILKAGWYLLDLINEILDLAIIESGRLSMSMEPVELDAVMQECHTLTETLAKKRGVVVTMGCREAGVYVSSDRTRLKQVVVNLMSNGIKYNRVGGSVTVTCTPLGERRLRISIEDTGEGLQPDQLAHLYQPFNRLGQEAHTERGTGIGLVMTKRLVELMGGEIGVKSVVGQGSIFWVDVNLCAPPGPTLNTDTDTDTEKPPLYTLLYVEDNPANLELVEEIMARRPEIRLLTTRDGISGVAKARAALPDVILMDINLPGISGLEALQILAQDATTRHIPVVALSANAMQRDIDRGLAAGFYRYLTKPIKLKEFLSTLNEALAASNLKANRPPLQETT